MASGGIPASTYRRNRRTVTSYRSIAIALTVMRSCVSDPVFIANVPPGTYSIPHPTSLASGQLRCDATHAPPTHACPAPHAVPQRPQCALLRCVSVSHPLPTSPSQLPHPISHASIAHDPPVHAARALA